MHDENKSVEDYFSPCFGYISKFVGDNSKKLHILFKSIIVQFFKIIFYIFSHINYNSRSIERVILYENYR